MMKPFSGPLLLCLGVCVFSSSAQAKRKHHPPATPAPLATPAAEPAPLPAEAAPSIRPDAPPSASLQPFLDTHLGSILAPLGSSACVQPELLAAMKASYADGMATAPATHQPAYRLAQNVCDALAGAMTERQNAVSALRGALATRSSEAEQPRGGGEAVEKARGTDAFFLETQRNNWIQRAGVLRQNVTALDLRERAAERQVGVWSPPPPAALAGAPAAVEATPSVSAPPAAPDPVVGAWLLASGSPITLNADHAITGSRAGIWRYTCTTNGGRNYELHWSHKNWEDYLELSSDGRSLAGHSKDNKPISLSRP